MIPQGDNTSHKDALDGVLSANQKVIVLRNADGSERAENVLDTEALWWQFHKISSPIFGADAALIKKLEAKAEQCFNHMCQEKAEVMSKQILSIVEMFKRSIDSKSSESRMNRENKQQTLIDTLVSNKSERVISWKEDAKRSIKEIIAGKEKEDQVY